MGALVRRLSLRAVVIGNMVDILATILFSLPLAFYVLLGLRVAQVPSEDVRAAFEASFRPGTPLYFCQLAIGWGCSILGGYIASRIAKCKELTTGALSSLLCMSFGIYTLATGSGLSPLYIGVLLVLASPLLGASGGYLYRVQCRYLRVAARKDPA